MTVMATLTDWTKRLTSARDAVRELRDADRSLRAEHTRLHEELGRLLAALPPREHTLAEIDRQVDALAARYVADHGARIVATLAGGLDVDPHHRITGVRPGSLAAAFPSALSLAELALVAPAMVKAGLAVLVNAVPLECGPPLADRAARAGFERLREARPAAPDDENPLRFASCGRPLPGHSVRIVDAAGHPLGERVEGRIEFRGPSVTSGYFQNSEATRAVLRSGWMDSGDLGYWASGELFITGRQKDIIIKAGRNLYPHEVEEVVGDIPGIRKGCVATLGMADPEAGTERLIVIAESRETLPEKVDRLRSAVVDRVVTAIGLPPDVVVIARPGAVLKTSSGKIRRSATRAAYLKGHLERPRASAAHQWVRLIARDCGVQVTRLVAQAAALLHGAYIAALLVATVPGLWGLLLKAPRGRPADRLVRAWCRAIIALSGCSLRVEGLEHLRAAAPAVLAANHASYVDAVALLAALPMEFAFVAKRELASSPLIGAVIRKTSHLPVERADPAQSAADAERATARLRGGTSLLFFPEGTFVRTPGLLPLRLGAFKAAVEAERPVIPIGLRGTRDILPDGTWLPRPGPITVAIGPPVTPEASGWQEMVRLRDLTRSELARLTGEPIVHGRPLTWADSKRNRLTTRLR